MRPSDFYQQHLNAVSRSFALCIPQLDEPFRGQVALSYLLLRVLDTVEDAPFAEKAAQQRQFEAFRGFLRKPPSRAQVDAFRVAFPARITDGERALLADTGAFFEDAHGLPPPARSAIFSAIDRMADGMALYASRPVPLRLVDVEDVTRYCCIVAGLVGELLTRLWGAAGGTAPRLQHAYRFGLFLQKVNILKDQAEDETAGRFLVPDRRELLASLRGDAEGALAYLTSLSRDARGYRTFCAWSLMLGAVSLSQLDRPPESHRAQTFALLTRIAGMTHDNDQLRQLFAELMPPLPESRPRAPVAKPESAERFARVLGAPLSMSDLADLGAVTAEPRHVASAG